jgi:osmotically-inducible protein OsmY
MMNSRIFGLMLGAAAMIVAGACTSTDKNTRPMNGGAVSDAKNSGLHGSIDTSPSARETKPQAAAPQARAKQPSSSSGTEAHDASDQREARITPLDQSESSNDLDTTRRIRQAVMQDESLSFKAKNVTIVTNGDRVVLTGRVNTRAEADRIKDIARSVTPHHIEDRLEIHQ